MDKQLEQKIRDRAYELWMKNGSLPGRAEEYWYQAEQEIRREADAQAASDVGGGTASDVGSYPASEEQAPVDVSPAPLGMTSETADEAQSKPEPGAPKTRKRRTSALAGAGEETAKGETPKRRRSTRTP